MSTGFRRKVDTNITVIKHSLNLIRHQSRDIQEMQQHIYLYVLSFFRSLVYSLGIHRTDTRSFSSYARFKYQIGANSIYRTVCCNKQWDPCCTTDHAELTLSFVLSFTDLAFRELTLEPIFCDPCFLRPIPVTNVCSQTWSCSLSRGNWKDIEGIFANWGFFWWTHVLWWDHWYPCFELLVTSPQVFKARMCSLILSRCRMPDFHGKPLE